MIHKYIKNINFIELWSIFLISGSLIPLLATLFPFININIGSPVLFVISYTPFFLTSFTLIWKHKQSLSRNIFTPQNLVLFSIISVILLSRIVALFYVLREMGAPILHDVIDHSLMAKSIVVENSINFFYSPLLHSVVATLSMGNIQEIPRLVVFITHLAVLMLSIQFSLLFYYYTKKVNLAIFVFIILCSLHFPANLYYLAGKNSLILALSIIPVCIFSLDRLFKKKSIGAILRLAISLLLLFFAHYPTFGILLFMISPWVLIEFYKTIRRKGYKDLLYYSFPFILSLLLASFWFMSTYHIQDELVTDSVGGGTPSPRLPITFEFFYKNLKIYYNDYLSRYFDILYIFILIPIFSKLGGIRIKATIIWVFLSLILLYTFIYTLQVDRVLGMVSNTMEIIYPSMMITIAVFLVGYISYKLKTGNKQILVCLIFLSFFSVLSNYYLFKAINLKHNQFNVVSKEDIKAFEFINTQLPDNIIILNGAQQDANRSELIFPVDGAMWIPLYTDADVVFDFRQVSSTKTHDNYELLMDLKTNTDDTPIIENLKSQGVYFGYIDQSVFGESLHEDFLNSIPYEIVFEEGTVKIIEFK